MKVKTSHLFLTIILIILIFLTMSNTCVNFKPQYVSSMNYSTFEAFQAPEAKHTNPTQNKKESFTNLDNSTYGNDDKPIDKFSGTEGNIRCSTISSGLTNSRGNLCLNNNQQQLLRTRGGNAAGGDIQISPSTGGF